MRRGRELMFWISVERDQFQSWGADRLKTGFLVVLRPAEGTERWMQDEDLRERAEAGTWRR